MTSTNTCKYCRSIFSHSRADVDICEQCFYSGEHLANRFGKTLERLREVNANASVWHTGGGCFAIGIPLDIREGEEFGRQILVTGALKEADSDEWYTDASLPAEENDETRWCVGIHGEEETGEEGAMPLSLDELCTWIDGFLEKEWAVA